LGLPKHFGSGVAYGGSNPARLGELGGNLLPHFPINRRREADPNIPTHLGYAF